MIQKDSIEWQLWKDAYSIKAELTPPPKYSESDAYWRTVLDKTNEVYEAYKDTPCKMLAQHICTGIILQLEQESLCLEKAS